MSGISHVEANLTGADQKTAPQENQEVRHEEGRENSHLNLDGKDQKSIANKLAQASAEEKREAQEDADKPKPTDAARANGNEPSRGAKIDEQIEKEEAEMLRKKGIEP